MNARAPLNRAPAHFKVMRFMSVKQAPVPGSSTAKCPKSPLSAR